MDAGGVRCLSGELGVGDGGEVEGGMGTLGHWRLGRGHGGGREDGGGNGTGAVGGAEKRGEGKNRGHGGEGGDGKAGRGGGLG